MKKTEIFLKDMSIDGSTLMSISINKMSTLNNLTEDFSSLLCECLNLHQTESTQFKPLSLTNVSDIVCSKIIYRQDNLFCLDFTYTHDHNEYNIEVEFLLPSFIEGEDHKQVCIQLEKSFEDELFISSWIQDDEILLTPCVEWSHEYELEDDHDSSKRYHEASENWSMNSLMHELLVSQEDDISRDEVDFFHCQSFLKEHVYVTVKYGCIHFYVYDFNYCSLSKEHSFRLSFDNEQQHLSIIKRYFSKYLLD